MFFECDDTHQAVSSPCCVGLLPSILTTSKVGRSRGLARWI
jgi:hypothetical protein